MALKWVSKPSTPQAPLTPEAPIIVLAAPGSIPPDSPTSRRWLLRALAAGSMAVLALGPYPGPFARPAASTFTVINLNASGVGSLRQAILNANANPGPDIITFQAGLAGTIPLSSQLAVTDTVQIQGPGPGLLSVSGSNVTRVFYISSTVPFTATISGLTIRDGSATRGSGGIRDKGESLILDNVAILSNTTTIGRGGGVELVKLGTNPNPGALTLRNSVISGNHATRGGGIFTSDMLGAVLIQNSQITSNTANTLQGGGAFFYKSTGDITIEDSTFAGNSTVLDGGGFSIYNTYGGQHVIRRTTITGNTAVNGAGLELYGVHQPLLIENSTISGNHASTNGGGVYMYGAITIRNSTIVSNTADANGGGIYLNGGTVPISNTIVANNSAPLNRDVAGGTFALSYDLVRITGTASISDAGGNVFGLDPLLLPLADNGGPTKTHLPANNSPVVNAGAPAFSPPPGTTDQRGDPRVMRGRVDIGAVEVLEELFLPVVRR